MWITLGDPYRAEVRDAKGESPPTTTAGFYHNEHINLGEVMGTSGDLDLRRLKGNGLYVTYKANESYADRAGISYLYNLDEPGTYTIIVSLAAFPAVRSNPVTVTVVAAPAAASATQQAPATPPFSLDIGRSYTGKAGAGLGLDVPVVTKNVSTHNIVLRRQEHERDSGLFGSTLRVHVQDSQGNLPPDTRLGRSTNHLADAPPDPAWRAAARAAGALVSLKPGEDWRTTIWVSDLYDVSKPGQYTIQVRRWDDETKTWVKSNAITVTVTP
jgi:hypothetical protein